MIFVYIIEYIYNRNLQLLPLNNCFIKSPLHKLQFHHYIALRFDVGTLYKIGRCEAIHINFTVTFCLQKTQRYYWLYTRPS